VKTKTKPKAKAKAKKAVRSTYYMHRHGFVGGTVVVEHLGRNVVSCWLENGRKERNRLYPGTIAMAVAERLWIKLPKSEAIAIWKENIK
jgi:hypothetical protein